MYPGSIQDRPAAELLARYFCSPDFARDSALLVDRVKPYVLDTLSVGLAGSSAKSSRIMASALLASSSGLGTVFGTGRSASIGDAALLNAAASHALELDDDHRIAVLHPGAVVVPAAFALAEAAGSSGVDLLRAILVGYEVAIRLGEVFKGGIFQHGLHPTPICGTFGAAAAGAVLLRLTETEFVRALGIAGTQAAGLTEWRADGSWIKRLNPGHSARSGVTAALLASKGFTGPSTILEGESGLYRAFGSRDALDPEALTRNLGSEFRTFGTAVKPYPCCRFAHGTIDLAIAARAVRAPQSIRAATIRIFRTDTLGSHTVPLNAVDAQFNLPFLVAVALLRGDVTLGDLADDAIRRPEVLELAGRIAVIEDEEFSRAFPATYTTTLEIAYNDGSVDFRRSDCPSGDPEAACYAEDPAAFGREVLAKSCKLLGELGFEGRGLVLSAAVDALGEQPDVTRLAELLREPGMHPAAGLQARDGLGPP